MLVKYWQNIVCEAQKNLIVCSLRAAKKLFASNFIFVKFINQCTLSVLGFDNNDRIIEWRIHSNQGQIVLSYSNLFGELTHNFQTEKLSRNNGYLGTCVCFTNSVLSPCLNCSSLRQKLISDARIFRPTKVTDGSHVCFLLWKTQRATC